jgi:hypothetical protein
LHTTFSVDHKLDTGKLLRTGSNSPQTTQAIAQAKAAADQSMASASAAASVGGPVATNVAASAKATASTIGAVTQVLLTTCGVSVISDGCHATYHVGPWLILTEFKLEITHFYNCIEQLVELTDTNCRPGVGTA